MVLELKVPHEEGIAGSVTSIPTLGSRHPSVTRAARFD